MLCGMRLERNATLCRFSQRTKKGPESRLIIHDGNLTFTFPLLHSKTSYRMYCAEIHLYSTAYDVHNPVSIFDEKRNSLYLEVRLSGAWKDLAREGQDAEVSVPPHSI
jgi:hypothetical protein